MLEAIKVSFAHGPDSPSVLANVSLALGRGEIIGLTGPSGSGKTTLARILAGYLRPAAGRVLLDGSPLPEAGICPVQLIFQHPELAVNPRWPIRRILAEGIMPSEELLAALQIDPAWFGRYPHELSGGQLQRICVARALAPQVRFIVADEMTAMLDAVTQARIWTVMAARARKQKIGVLAISHNRPLLERLCHRIHDLGQSQSG